MIYRLRCFCLILIASSPLQLLAQVYSLDSCVEMAMRSNKDIQAASHLAQRFQYESKALHANFFPNISVQAVDMYSTLSGSAGYDLATPASQFFVQRVVERYPTIMDQSYQQYLTRSMASDLRPLNPDFEFKMKNFMQASVQVEQPIYMGGKITAGDKIGRLGARIAGLGVNLSREEVLVNVYDAYHLLVKAKELRIVALKYDSLLVQLTNDVQSALRHGMVSHNEELKVQVKKNEAELKIRQAENGIRLARMNLCQLVGLPLDTPIDTEQDQDTTYIALIDRYATVEGRTEYQMLELKTRLAEQQVKLERYNLLPQIGIVGQAGMIDGLEMVGDKMFRHEPVVSVMAALKIPIFHANETRHKVAAAKQQLEQSRLEQESLREKLNLDLQQQANQVDEAQLEITLCKRNLEQCAENLRICRSAYSVGYETLSELLTAQLLWQQAYAELVEAKYQMKTKMMKWRKAAGRL